MAGLPMEKKRYWFHDFNDGISAPKVQEHIDQMVAAGYRVHTFTVTGDNHQHILFELSDTLDVVEETRSSA